MCGSKNGDDGDAEQSGKMSHSRVVSYIRPAARQVLRKVADRIGTNGEFRTLYRCHYGTIGRTLKDPHRNIPITQFISDLSE